MKPFRKPLKNKNYKFKKQTNNMDYTKKVLNHFTKLQWYVTQASGAKNFPTKKHLSAINNRILQGKQMIRELPVNGKRKERHYIAVLDTLLSYRPEQKDVFVYLLVPRLAIINWARANKVRVRIDTINLDNTNLNIKYFAGQLKKVTLMEKNYGGQDVELQRGSEGNQGQS